VTALAQFQLGQGLVQTGVGAATTLSRLGVYRAPGAPTCVVSAPVRLHSVVGSACVESRLAQLGLTGQAPDANFTSTSVSALRLFQFSVGLGASGVADQATLGALGIWRAPAASLCTVSVTVRQNSTVGATCVETRLRQLGFTSQTPDGFFNATSVQALRHYQHNVGLAADGIAGQVTLTALGVWKPPPNPFPVPANSGSGRRIVYSRAQQRIWAIDSSGVVVKTHRVSGRTYEPSRGTYSVYSRSLYTYSASDPSGALALHGPVHLWLPRGPDRLPRDPQSLWPAPADQGTTGAAVVGRLRPPVQLGRPMGVELGRYRYQGGRALAAATAYEAEPLATCRAATSSSTARMRSSHPSNTAMARGS